MRSGGKAVLDNRRLAYPLMLGMLLLSAALSLAAALTALRGMEEAAGWLGQGFRIAHLLFFLSLGLYVLELALGSGFSRAERYGGILLIAVVLAGVFVQRFWDVRVELFFDAVACFGALALFEQTAATKERFRHSALAAIALVFLAVIFLNVTLILKMTADQSDEIGRIQLDVIRGDLQDTLAEAQTRVLRVAIRTEQLLDERVSREELAAYFEAQRGNYLSDENFMNVYVAGPDWYIIPDFDAPPSFHANERVWYIGARDNPGTLYITEPYLDANTGTMCITVSTLLADRETVVGMDLNFTQVQQSIARLTRGTDRSAMIVTESGMLVGYSDMSLVGEQAEQKLPEYAEVLRRFISSQEHGSFTARLGGRQCVIFSAETSNGWYLILSVGADTLYAESHRQMAMLAAVNLMMLLVVVIYYLLTTRARLHAARATENNSRYLAELGDRLRRAAGQILRLSEWRLIQESSNPAEVVGQIHGAGQELAELAEGVQGYGEVLRRQYEKTPRGAGNAPPARRAAACETASSSPCCFLWSSSCFSACASPTTGAAPASTARRTTIRTSSAPGSPNSRASSICSPTSSPPRPSSWRTIRPRCICSMTSSPTIRRFRPATWRIPTTNTRSS